MGHLTVLMMAVCSAAQADPDAQEFAKQGKAWLGVCSAHVASYEISVTAPPQEKLRCVPRPIFRHAQVVRGGQDIGAVWLWIRKASRYLSHAENRNSSRMTYEWHIFQLMHLTPIPDAAARSIRP